MYKYVGQSDSKAADGGTRLPWKRPKLSRVKAHDAESGTVGGGDTPGKDMMS